VVSTVCGHAYPWDVLGDPDFPGRVAGLGVDTVVLAAAYHSVRAATPLHPQHQIVEASHAALYRPVRPEVWRGRRLAPLAQTWLDRPDPFGAAARQLTDAGLPVSAWLVFTHNTRLGTAHPDVAVVNCFGEPYPYALCPSRPEVRDYAALLAAEAVRDVDLAEVSLEACGQLGVAHAGCHDKTAGAWTEKASRLLSICCCGACRTAWGAGGLVPARLVAQLQDAVRSGSTMDGTTLSEVLAVRHRATDALRGQILAAIRDAAPGVRVVLHTDPDPWATGAAPGLTSKAARDVDALLVPCWSTGQESADAVVAAATSRLAVDAYVTALPPSDPDRLTDHARRLLAAGAGRLSLYHLGLAASSRQRNLREMASLAVG
jgi:hypothetical protein